MGIDPAVEPGRSGPSHVQLGLRHLARNVFSNWFITGANMVVGLFLAPFIVHRLGPAAYGVWVLAISSVNYLALLDLGMRSAVLRFVSKGHATGDHAAASEALSAALRVRLQISGAVLVLAAALAAAFPHLFRIADPSLAQSARVAVMIIGTTLSLGMSIGVFGGVLSALNRYDLQSGVSLVQLAVRVTGVVWALRTGHGIVAVALCELVAAIVGNAALVVVALRLYPEIRLTLQKPRPGVLRGLWNYSLYAFLTTVAVQLVYQTDNLVVGSCVSATAVTFYAIGNSLCRYADQFIGAVSATFVPAASTYEASGRLAELRSLYVNGTRTTLVLALPVLLTLTLRGSSFIGLWMGNRFSFESGRILILLAIPLIFMCANRTAASIAFGVEKHKRSAQLAIGEGVANLVLSITLVHTRLGIYGVAAGTLIPSLVVQLFFWPNYIKQLVGLGIAEVYTRVWGRVFLAAVPYAAATWWVERFLPAHSLVTFGLETLALLPIFAGMLLLLFRVQVQTLVMPRLRSYLPGSVA